ncbi:MAG: hypothetical protein QME12_04520 [Nanoarchaeota archaeon]|nr:hypothetical protein [Nanoarchaeota archaeon]
MNKRGTSHADWAISLGIFLLYILSMLMLIQPGVQPFYKEGELLSIVTENYRDSTSFAFYKTLIVIDTTDMNFTPGTSEYLVTLNAETGAAFPFSGDPNDYAVTDRNMASLDNFYIAHGWDVIRFKAPITDTPDNKFYIISNKLADGTSKPYLDRGDASSGLEISNSDIAPHTPNFTLTIGSTEVLQGVSEDLLKKDADLLGLYCLDANLGQAERKYGAIKRRWGFPTSKDFMILYADTASAMYNPEDAPVGNIHPVCRNALPYEQANVVVEEWAARIVDEFGNTVPIRMVARVW